MPTSRRSISLVALLIPPALLAGSLAVLAVGIVMSVSESDGLVAALNSPEATAVDVYGGQARLAIATSVLGAGIVAVVLALATVAVTGTIRAFTPRHQDARPEVVTDEVPPEESAEHWSDVDVETPADGAPAEVATPDEARSVDAAAPSR